MVPAEMRTLALPFTPFDLGFGVMAAVEWAGAGADVDAFMLRVGTGSVEVLVMGSGGRNGEGGAGRSKRGGLGPD